MINEHKRKAHVLILGLEGVGKTLLIKKLKGMREFQVINTIVAISEQNK